jgi:hypothetical protein
LQVAAAAVSQELGVEAQAEQHTFQVQEFQLEITP